MSTLYQLADEMHAAVSALEADPDSPEAWAILEEVGGTFTAKVESCACAIKELVAIADAIDEEISAQKKRADAKRAAAKRLREYVMEQFDRAGQKSVETARARVAIRPNPLKVQWTRPPEDCPGRFRRVITEVSVDIKAAHEALRAGEDLPDGFTVSRGRSLVVG
jgi:hypothetical protein